MKAKQPPVNGFLKLLEHKQTELVQISRQRDGIVIETSADPMDQVQNATERDLAIHSADRDANLLRQVRAALQRVGDGSFGICLHCDEPISTRRLEALPWAQRCVQCQETLDLNPMGIRENNLGRDTN